MSDEYEKVQKRATGVVTGYNTYETMNGILEQLPEKEEER